MEQHAMREDRAQDKSMVLCYDRDEFLDYLVQYWLVARASQERRADGTSRAVLSDRTLAVLLSIRNAVRAGGQTATFKRECQAVAVPSKSIPKIVEDFKVAKTMLGREPGDDLQQLVYKQHPFFNRTTAFPSEDLFTDWKRTSLDIALLLHASLRHELEGIGIPLMNVEFGGPIFGGTIDDMSWIGIRDTETRLSPSLTVTERAKLLAEPISFEALFFCVRASWLSGPAVHAL